MLNIVNVKIDDNNNNNNNTLKSHGRYINVVVSDDILDKDMTLSCFSDAIYLDLDSKVVNIAERYFSLPDVLGLKLITSHTHFEVNGNMIADIYIDENLRVLGDYLNA